MNNQGWFCPGCNKYHGPHVDTCPYDPGLIPNEMPWHQPSTTPIQPTFPPEWNPNPNRCNKCGLILGAVVGYVCNDIKCPTGLGPSVCLTE